MSGQQVHGSPRALEDRLNAAWCQQETTPPTPVELGIIRWVLGELESWGWGPRE